MIRSIAVAACTVIFIAGVASADPAAEQNSKDFFARQTTVRPDVAVQADYDMLVAGMTMGASSIAIAPDQRDGHPCYRLEVTLAAKFGDQTNENVYRSWITPDFRVLYEEQQESLNGTVTYQQTITLEDGMYREVETEEGGPEAVNTFAHQQGMLHSGMDVLLIFLLDRTVAQRYAFTSHETGKDPHPTEVVVGAPEQRTIAGVPMRVTPLRQIDTKPGKVEEFWFAFADDGRMVEWGGGDAEMPIVFRLTSLAAVKQPLDIAAVKRLANPVDPVLLHLHGIVIGDAALATSVIDAGRFAAHIVANDPALGEDALNSGVAATAAEAAIADSVAGWPPEAVEMIKMLLAPGACVVREADAGFARVTFNDEISALPGMGTLQFFVEQDATTGQWEMVLMGTGQLQRAPLR